MAEDSSAARRTKKKAVTFDEADGGAAASAPAPRSEVPSVGFGTSRPAAAAAAAAASSGGAAAGGGLMKQDLAALPGGLAALTPLTDQVISRQATINIGTIGHVAHGKSTVVKAISGVKVRVWRVWCWCCCVCCALCAFVRVFVCGHIFTRRRGQPSSEKLLTHPHTHTP